MNLVVLLLLVASAGTVMGARILAVLPITIKSHHILFNAVLRTLAEAGHEVVCFSGLPADKEVANLTVIELSNMIPVDKSVTREWLDFVQNTNPIGFTSHLFEKSREFSGELSRKKQFMDFYNSNERFDLIILEAFFAQESLFALGHKFNAPVVSLQPFGAFSLVSRTSGSPLNLAFIPDFSLPYSNHMSFYQRAINAYSILSVLFKYYVYYIPEQDQYMRQIFNDSSLPPLLDIIYKRYALTLQNAHPYIHYTQPHTPNIQLIGGIHLSKELKPLPYDIKAFLDGSPDGVIYFSVGSIVPDHLLDDEYFNNFLFVFRRLPQRVLWKTKRDLKNLPNNVKTSKWLPQQDVLAHPNMRVFMTHGGMFSQHEAIHAGVPVICTPYFADQPMNAKFYEERGIGVVLPFQTLSEETILSALTAVLNESKYRDNMARMSRIYRDRPLSPADTILYWVEYVIRHGGAPHLRPVSADMPLYQLYLLDVVGTVLVTLLIAYLILCYVLKRILGIIWNKNKHSRNYKIKKNN